jgi:hypothetical protein
MVIAYIGYSAERIVFQYSFSRLYCPSAVFSVSIRSIGKARLMLGHSFSGLVAHMVTSRLNFMQTLTVTLTVCSSPFDVLYNSCHLR